MEKLVTVDQSDKVTRIETINQYFSIKNFYRIPLHMRFLVLLTSWPPVCCRRLYISLELKPLRIKKIKIGPSLVAEFVINMLVG